MTGPLTGLRVLDLGQYLAGPFGPMVLGDLGADVIKIEPLNGDAMRGGIKPFFGCQRGKRSLALDLKHPRGLAVALELVATSDVVHTNMTKGVADRLGIGYEACRAANPSVVYCNTYMYGPEGPLSHFGGLDPLSQAAAGLEYEAGAMHEGNPPLYLRFGMTDASNAMLSVVGVLSALYHRARTGEGQELWTSLIDGGAFFASDALLAGGEPVPLPRLDKGQYGLGPGYRLYRTQDEQWIQVAAVSDDEWHALCRAVGEDPMSERGPDMSARSSEERRAEVEAVLEARFQERTAWSWHLLLDAAGVPNELPIDTHNGTLPLYDADNVALGLVTEYDHPVQGRLRQFGSLIDFGDAPAGERHPPPLVGQHSREVLRELGYDDAAIDALIADGVTTEPGDDYAQRHRC